MLTLVEGADEALRSVARVYVDLADEVERCDALATSARARIASAGVRLSAVESRELERIDRDAQRGRARLASTVGSPSVIVRRHREDGSPSWRRRILHGGVVALSISVFVITGVAIIGVVSGFTATPALGILDVLVPPNFIEAWMMQWPNC